MFCSNCGKELKDGDKFCESCGMMVKREETAAAAEPQNLPVPAPKKKSSGKTAAIIIGIVSGVVILACLVTLTAASLISSYRHRNDHNGHNYPGMYDDYDDYDDFGDYFDGFFDDDNDGLYPGYSGGGNNGGGQNSAPAQTPAATAQPDDSLPPDSNGKTYDDPAYQWPTGDGTYEFYAKSTIPKFESVTGKPCTDTDVEDGNTYYEYDMDMDAYNAYIKALEAAGYTQSEFDARGKNSYVRYEKGVQYLVIYLMNTDNEIVIMA